MENKNRLIALFAAGGIASLFGILFAIPNVGMKIKHPQFCVKFSIFLQVLATVLTMLAGYFILSPAVPAAPAVPAPPSTLWESVWYIQLNLSDIPTNALPGSGGEGLEQLGGLVFTKMPGGSVAAVGAPVAPGRNDDAVGFPFIIGELTGADFTGFMAAVPVTGTFSTNFKTFTLKMNNATLVWTVQLPISVLISAWYDADDLQYVFRELPHHIEVKAITQGQYGTGFSGVLDGKTISSNTGTGTFSNNFNTFTMNEKTLNVRPINRPSNLFTRSWKKSDSSDTLSLGNNNEGTHLTISDVDTLIDINEVAIKGDNLIGTFSDDFNSLLLEQGNEVSFWQVIPE
jgi:hypothetical protein